MSLYIVGDIQGCYRELMALLDHVGFSHQSDQLWCVGDIVARGPDSLEALRFFVDSPNASVRTVLGNHDLNLIGVLLGTRDLNPKDKLGPIVESTRRLDWIDWLRQQPLMHWDPQRDVAVSHAGIYPWWTLTDAQNCASDVEAQLQSEKFASFIKTMFGNEPTQWSSSLRGIDRYRFIVNAFTRMRYCDQRGHLEFSLKSHPRDNVDSGWQPWFHHYRQPTQVAFGHWAALMGETESEKIIGLDTGCVWGNYMTLWDVDSKTFYRQPAVKR